MEKKRDPMSNMGPQIRPFKFREERISQWGYGQEGFTSRKLSVTYILSFVPPFVY